MLVAYIVNTVRLRELGHCSLLHLRNLLLSETFLQQTHEVQLRVTVIGIIDIRSRSLRNFALQMHLMAQRMMSSETILIFIVLIRKRLRRMFRLEV